MQETTDKEVQDKQLLQYENPPSITLNCPEQRRSERTIINTGCDERELVITRRRGVRRAHETPKVDFKNKATFFVVVPVAEGGSFFGG